MIVLVLIIVDFLILAHKINYKKGANKSDIHWLNIETVLDLLCELENITTVCITTDILFGCMDSLKRSFAFIKYITALSGRYNRDEHLTQ